MIKTKKIANSSWSASPLSFYILHDFFLNMFIWMSFSMKLHRGILDEDMIFSYLCLVWNLTCFSPALPLPFSCPAPFKLLSRGFLAPPQFLSSSCPLSAQICFTLLSSTPALFLPCCCPALDLLLPYSWPNASLILVPPTPVWQPSSSSAPFDFFWHGESRLLWYK